MSEKKPEILNLEKASKYLGLSPREVIELASHGQIPARRIEGEWYFSDRTLEPYSKTYGLKGYAQRAAGSYPLHFE